jgi:GIY-YIG catalytic domain
MKKSNHNKGKVISHQPLVMKKLEMVSKDIFSHYSKHITKLIGDSPGVYALYDDNELYYVGRATDLQNRVNQHLHDRHIASWTHFSLYLASKKEHIHEIESLIVRIANPKGNRVMPGGKSSGSLIKELMTLVRQTQEEDLYHLFGQGRRQKTTKNKAVRGRRTLAGLVKRRTPLYKSYKRKDYNAALLPNGTIELKSKRYLTPTAAAKAIVQRSVNGLLFWFIEDLNGDWVKLAEFMKNRHGLPALGSSRLSLY